MYSMLKRVMDIGLSLMMLPVLIPLGIGIWIIVRLVDGYPPLFIQKRVGHLEKPIYIYKFRTIKPGGTEEDITRCGKILRRFRWDEIPQVWNVLKGDISFVGPRPIWGNEYDFLNKYVPNHNIRTIVKPGITGWAQLNFKAPPTYFNFRNDAPENLDPHAFDAAFKRLSYDVWYIKNHSIALDIEILVKTGLRMFIKDSHVE
ncbi:MAG: sugar transferase [Elusimicrobiaceae bacterium]|nr:sugar transferase [Elusimicrobiaceae bacterium]